jgi:hypothetical protein
MANGQLSGHMAAAPSTTPWATASRQRPDPCEDDCTPRCPACGGLKCSCRPRFFPGQLLTDRELNGLEQYVVDKNRLHNRYLHGWGVACGLEVTCDGCDSGHVVVRSGYAVAPCGDDIVLCADQSVDVCALINSCEPKRSDCNDPYDQPPRDCAGGERDWVLAVCYDERPVRGITAQLSAGDSPGPCACGCGGSGACGCGGGAGSSGNGGGCGGCSSCGGPGNRTAGCSCGSSSSGRTQPVRGHRPQCEPTQICEGYRFIAYPVPKAGRAPVPGTDNQKDYLWAWLYANRSRFGPLIDRVLCCATKAMELRQSIREGASLAGAAGLATYSDYAEALAELAEDFAIHRCSFVGRARELRDQARAARKQTPGAAIHLAAINQLDLSSRVRDLDDLWLQIVSECLCSALLPACPSPASTNCVPLAVVTVDPDDCRVVDICNWSQRRILITWPTVTYWLSWLPWGRLLGWVQQLCCGTEGGREAYALLALMFSAVFNQGTRTKAAAYVAAPPMEEAAMHEAGAAVGKPPEVDPLDAAFDAGDLLGHMLDDVARMSREGPEATGQPAWAGIAARVLDGTILSVGTAAARTAPASPATASPATASPATAPGPDVEELARRLDEAEKTIRAQGRRITTLSKKGGAG